MLAACRRSPQLLRPLLAMAGDLETPFAARIGVGAVLEDLAPDGLLKDAVDDMVELAASRTPRSVRDARISSARRHAQARAVLDRLAHDENRGGTGDRQ